jgi:FkbM family methyltransferase
VYAFEPMPSNYALLVKNIEENKFQHIVRPYQLACSDSSAVLKGYMNAGMYIAGEVGTGERVVMEAVRVDDMIEGAINIIKIDVEGHEPMALDGMQSIIANHRPIILSEINEYWLRTCSHSDANQYVSLLNSLGYEVYDVKDVDTPIIRGSLHIDILGTMDIICYPKEKTI